MRRIKVFWFVVLCFFVSGCASTSYRYAELPQLNPQGEVNFTEETVVAGSVVQVTLHSGLTISGKVIEVSNGRIVINSPPENKGDYTTVLSEDIESIYMEVSDDTATTWETLPWYGKIGFVIVMIPVVIIAIIADATSQ